MVDMNAVVQFKNQQDIMAHDLAIKQQQAYETAAVMAAMNAQQQQPIMQQQPQPPVIINNHFHQPGQTLTRESPPQKQPWQTRMDRILGRSKEMLGFGTESVRDIPTIEIPEVKVPKISGPSASAASAERIPAVPAPPQQSDDQVHEWRQEEEEHDHDHDHSEREASQVRRDAFMERLSPNKEL